ncbi:MAG: hypothetical protein IMF07_09380 [Proteobacteria bacterium]|nr:hypothetical protein [Pseudomonadota bacterium]
MNIFKKSKMLWAALSIMLLAGMAGMPAPALADDVILYPGYLSGSVTVTGQNITKITVRAIDTAQVYSASVTETVDPDDPPTSSINYNLTVESDRSYYLIAEVWTAGGDSNRVVTPVIGPEAVPLGATVTGVDLTVTPASISGTISTTTAGNTIESFHLYARISVPQFPGIDQWFYNRTSAYGLSVDGSTGRNYTLLVTPGYEYYFYRWITINGIQYYSSETVSSLAAGATLTRDFPIDVTAATISGISTLGGPTDIYYANIYGWASPPYRTTTTPKLLTDAYSLEVDAGTWNIQPRFQYYLTGLTPDLNGLQGYLFPPTRAVSVNDGDHLTENFSIDPGYITGFFNLSGANTVISDGYIRAYSTPGGYSYSWLRPGTGKYMAVVSPGDWQYNYLYLAFDYPADPDSSLRSYLWHNGSFLGPYTVASGQTVTADATFGTATVRLYYYVEGGGQLSYPSIEATRAGLTSPTARAYGSTVATTEGQAIVTLLPGTYTIEAFANVEGSNTEFGTHTVTVAEGDVVVIGGLGKPIIQVTNPTDGETVADYSVTVEGTTTDTEGIASITINGEVVFTGDPNNPLNEVAFSHAVDLPNDGANTIEVIATDTDGNAVTLTLTVYRDVPVTLTTLTYTGDTLVQVNTPVSLSASLVDENGQAVSDAGITFQAAVQSCTEVTDTYGVADCELSIPIPGVYPVDVAYAGDATHQSSAATALLTVYDPEGGFVTGGGWMMSPAGAYAADSSLTGKANFGFVSKYKRGATIPTGQTEFQFKVAGLNFHSESYEWLVVAGKRAQYKGTGTINNEGSYGFMLTAIDGAINGDGIDKFRIKIWDKANNGAIVYDNQMGSDDNTEPATVIGGGSIVIHTK